MKSGSGEAGKMAESFDTKLSAVIAKCVAGFEELVSADRLSGGASQETYRIDIQANGRKKTLALRRAPSGEEDAASTSAPGLEVEAKLFDVARQAGVPEPEVHHVLTEADGLGAGFLMEWLEGETLGARINKIPELDEIRPKLAHECGQILARIHDIDLTASGLSDVLTAMTTKEVVETMWEQYKEYETPRPMIDYTARWLLEHLPPETDLRLTHNDFRNGNLMISPDGLVAVLDWELAYIGDPVRDLGWICTNSWRFGRYDLPVGGFGTREDLLAGYEAESGRRIDAEHLRFWEVFGSFWWAISCLKMYESWRDGPEKSVERPAIARRSSECQTDCANLIIPGPVYLLEPAAPASTIDMPTSEELLTSVRDFLRNDIRGSLEGRNSFMALVASNSLDIVLREMTLGPAHLEAERARLASMFGSTAPLEELRWQVVRGLRDGAISLDHPGLADHLRNTVVNQLAIDQPKYSGLKAALAHTGKQA